MALQIPNISGAALGPGSSSRSGSPSGGQLAALILQAYGAKSSGDPMAHRTALDKVGLEYDKKLLSQKQAEAKKREKLTEDLKVATEKYEALVGSETLKNEAMGYLQAGDYKKFLTVAPFINDLDPNIVKAIEERQARAVYGKMTPEQRATDAQRLGKTTPRQRAILGGLGADDQTRATQVGLGLETRALEPTPAQQNYEYINKLEEEDRELFRRILKLSPDKKAEYEEKLDMIDEWEKNGEITPEEAKQDREDLRAQFLDVEEDEEATEVPWAEYQNMTPENKALYDRYKGRTGRGPSAAQQANENAGKSMARKWLEFEGERAGLSKPEVTEYIKNLERQPFAKTVEALRAWSYAKPVTDEFTQTDKEQLIDQFDGWHLTGSGKQGNEIESINEALEMIPIGVRQALIQVTSDTLPNSQRIKINGMRDSWENDEAVGDTNYNFTKSYLASLALDKTYEAERKWVLGREQMQVALGVIEDQLTELKDAGIDTNLITGTMEEIYQKLGTTTHPKLSKAITILRMAIFAYRSAISGAAFTESEARSYVELFPGIGSTFENNMAAIDGMQTITAANSGLFYNTYLGFSGASFIANRKVATIDELLKQGGVDRYSLPEKLPEIEYDPIALFIQDALDAKYTRSEIMDQIKVQWGEQDPRYIKKLSSEFWGD